MRGGGEPGRQRGGVPVGDEQQEARAAEGGAGLQPGDHVLGRRRGQRGDVEQDDVGRERLQVAQGARRVLRDVDRVGGGQRRRRPSGRDDEDVSPGGAAQHRGPRRRRVGRLRRRSRSPRHGGEGGVLLVLLREALRRGGVEQPVVARPAQRALVGERLERQRHRRAPGADHVPELLVRQRQVEPDAVGGNAAVALGHRPEQRHEAVLHPRELRDRLQEEPLPRLQPGATVEPAGHPRPARARDQHAVVEHQQPRLPLDPPRRPDAQRDGRLAAEEHDVAGHEEPRAHAPADVQAGDDGALRHEHAERGTADVGARLQLLGVPHAALELDRRQHDRPPRVLQRLAPQVRCQVGIDVQQPLTRVRGHVRDGSRSDRRSAPQSHAPREALCRTRTGDPFLTMEDEGVCQSPRCPGSPTNTGHFGLHGTCRTGRRDPQTTQ